MTLADAILAAEREPDRFERSVKVMEVAGYMRYCLGWNYTRMMQAVEKCGVPAQRWESLLYAAESEAQS